MGQSMNGDDPSVMQCLTVMASRIDRNRGGPDS